MNILFVGPYRQSDGWGYAAREYIRALRLTKYNLCVRPVYMNSQKSYEDFDEFTDLENRKFESYDIIIQNCLPHMFRRYGDAQTKNIGLSYFETSTILPTPWPLSINTMDEIWVTSSFERRTLLNSMVKIPINVVHIPTDHTKYEKEYEYFKPLENHKDEFKFYYIGELSERKDVSTLIAAFHREFHPNEKVRLVLKVNQVGLDEQTVLFNINRLISQIRRSLNLSSYKEDVVITKYLTQDELFSLHKSCDCFVMPSSGEAFSMPTFDAMMCGNLILINKNSSITQYECGTGIRVDSHECPAIVDNKPLPFLYTGRDTWYKISMLDLQKKMRRATELDRNKIRSSIIKNAHTTILPNYKYDAVAKQIEELLG